MWAGRRCVGLQPQIWTCDAALLCSLLARLLSQFAIDHLPDAPGRHLFEHGFGLSGLDLVANPELPFPEASLYQCYTKFHATMLHCFRDGSLASVNSGL